MTTGHEDYLEDLWDLLAVDPTDFLENPPTEDQSEKGPTSEWAFDHEADISAHHIKYTDLEALAVADARILIHKGIVDAHHVKYTDANSRAAISNIFGADGKADADIDLDGQDLKGGDIIIPDGGTVGQAAGPLLTFDDTNDQLRVSGCDLGINEADPQELLHVSSSTANKPLVRIENKANDTLGPFLIFYKTGHAIPADNDILGNQVGRGLDSGLNDTQFMNIQFRSSDVTTGDDAGEVRYRVKCNGALRNLLSLDGYGQGFVGGAEVVINEQGVDCDFRVETDTRTHTLFCEGSTNRIGMNISTPLAQLDIDQPAAGGDIPVLKLDQADIDREIIEFVGSSGAGKSIETAEQNTFHRMILIDINGTPCWLKVFVA